MKCPKCGYVRKPGESAHDYECPSCGVVYAKVRTANAAMNEHPMPKRTRTERKEKLGSAMTVVGGLLIATALFGQWLTGSFEAWLIVVGLIGLATFIMAMIINRGERATDDVTDAFGNNGSTSSCDSGGDGGGD